MSQANPTATAEELVTLIVAGVKVRDIATKYGVSRQAVSRWLQRDDVLELLDEVQAEARTAALRHGRNLAGRAVSVYADALTAERQVECPACEHRYEAPDHAIRIKAADSIADRFGLPRTEVSEVSAAEPLAARSDAELERLTLEEAARILDERGEHATAAAIRSHIGA